MADEHFVDLSSGEEFDREFSGEQPPSAAAVEAEKYRKVGEALVRLRDAAEHGNAAVRDLLIVIGLDEE